MSYFDPALAYTMLNEGGGKYTDNPIDNGGPTKWGVTLRTLSAYRGKACTANDVKMLTFDDVKPLYRSFYWLLMRCEDIKEEALSRAVFDSSVLFGTTRAAKVIQASINLIAGPKTKPLTVDGRVGPLTIAALNAQPCGVMLHAYVTELEEAVVDIVQGNPKQIMFLSGWLRRIGLYLVLQFTCATGSTPAVS